MIPGGYSPDKIRTSPGMVALTRDMHQGLKPVAAICHAGWMLAEADIVRGKTVTSYHSIKTDLRNAGADWVDQEVVEAVSDAGGIIITSRPTRATCPPSARRCCVSSSNGRPASAGREDGCDGCRLG